MTKITNPHFRLNLMTHVITGYLVALTSIKTAGGWRDHKRSIPPWWGKDEGRRSRNRRARGSGGGTRPNKSRNRTHGVGPIRRKFRLHRLPKAAIAFVP